MNFRAYPFAVLGAMALCVWLLYPRTRLPLSFDAIHVYLPMARSVLAEGWAFMQRPEALAAGPVAFLYPALLGAGEATLRWANIALYAATTALGFHALRLAHSWRSGVAAAFLLAVSPTLLPYMADVLTEPPFVFLMAVWIVAVAEIASGRSLAWIAIGAIALALATLTRPAVMYFAPLMAAVFAWRAFRHRGRTDARLAMLHVAALALVALWIVRNAMAFGFPGVATGAGAALFFGVNPLVDGFDPRYFGMDYDSGAVHPDMSHLSIEADRILRGVALLELRDTPVAIVAEMFVRKAGAFLLVTSAEPSGEPLALLRAWRILLVVLAAVALLRAWRSTIVLALAALAGYMVAVHLPVVYHHRYSVGAVDLPLTLLAAIGLAEAMRNTKWMAFTLAAAIVGVGFGLLDAARAAPRSPRPERVPHDVAWLRNVDERIVLRPGAAAIEIPVDKDPATGPWQLSIVAIDLSLQPEGKGAGCTAMRLRYRPASEATFGEQRVTRVPLAPGAGRRTLVIGAAIPVRLSGTGVVRLEFDCASPATLEVGTMAVIDPRRAGYYRDLYRERQKRAGSTPQPPPR